MRMFGHRPAASLHRQDVVTCMRAGRKRLRGRGSLLGDQKMGIRPSNQPQALLELGCGAGRVAEV